MNIQNLENKIESILFSPLLSIPIRVIWLVINISILSLATLGAYTAQNGLLSGSYDVDELDGFYRTMWILDQFRWIIQLCFIYYVSSTILGIYKDISKYYNFKLNIELIRMKK